MHSIFVCFCNGFLFKYLKVNIETKNISTRLFVFPLLALLIHHELFLLGVLAVPTELERSHRLIIVGKNVLTIGGHHHVSVALVRHSAVVVVGT